MKSVSFICCYTKEKMVNQLKQSVSDFQSFDIEWVLVDNANNAYTSAASALNAGAKLSESDILVFLHQDIEFDSEKTLDLIYRKAKEGWIVGVAGRKADGGALVTSIDDGIHKERHHNYYFNESSEEVLTCDECLIAMNREVFMTIGGFDEMLFDGWHFYGVDFCLQAHKKNIKSCVVPSRLWHKSTGNHDKNWEYYERVLRKKYRNDYRVIYYPCGRCYTNLFLFTVSRMLRPIRKLYLSKRTGVVLQ